MPVFCSNCKNCICFPLHTSIFLVCANPFPSITLSDQECLSCGARFLSWGLFLQEFICGCCNAFKDARPVQICAASVEGSRSGACAQLLSWMLQGFVNLELMTTIASKGNDWRLLASCFQLSCDQAVVSTFWENKHPITPHDSSLSLD